MINAWLPFTGRSEPGREKLGLGGLTLRTISSWFGALWWLKEKRIHHKNAPKSPKENVQAWKFICFSSPGGNEGGKFLCPTNNFIPPLVWHLFLPGSDFFRILKPSLAAHSSSSNSPGVSWGKEMPSISLESWNYPPNYKPLGPNLIEFFTISWVFPFAFPFLFPHSPF